MEKFSLVAGLFNLAFILNLPSGYLRAKARRFSLRWFIFVHLPIPFIVVARILSHMDYRYIPVLVISSVIGQIIGSKLRFEV